MYNNCCKCDDIIIDLGCERYGSIASAGVTLTFSLFTVFQLVLFGRVCCQRWFSAADVSSYNAVWYGRGPPLAEYVSICSSVCGCATRSGAHLVRVPRVRVIPCCTCACVWYLRCRRRRAYVSSVDDVVGVIHVRRSWDCGCASRAGGRASGRAVQHSDTPVLAGPCLADALPVRRPVGVFLTRCVLAYYVGFPIEHWFLIWRPPPVAIYQTPVV